MSHAGHDHRPPAAPGRALAAALTIVSLFAVGELVAALMARSMALATDSAHMVTDVSALAMSLYAARLATRPASVRWSFGLRRAEVISAGLNGVTLGSLAAVILVLDVIRLVRPAPADGLTMIVVGAVGALVNLAATGLLRPARGVNLNVRGAYLHVVTDLAAFGATIVAGVVVVATGFVRADVLASLVVVVLMVRSAISLLAETGRILMQGTPSGLDLDELRAVLLDVAHVIEVHDVHAWTLSSDATTLAAHVVVEDHCFVSGHAPQVLDDLQARVAGRFGIEHATFQLEPAAHLGHEGGAHH